MCRDGFSHPDRLGAQSGDFVRVMTGLDRGGGRRTEERNTRGPYIVRRLLLLVPVLLGVTLITFALTRIIPGNPVDRMVSPMSSQEVRDRVAAQHGLNDPMPLQYLRYVRNTLQGNLAILVTSQPVLRDLLAKFPATLRNHQATPCSSPS